MTKVFRHTSGGWNPCLFREALPHVVEDMGSSLRWSDGADKGGATPVPWPTAALAALAQGATALVTILATEGSAPRGAGTRMIVTAAGATGTIGGGRLEHRVTEQARAILALAPGAWRIQDYPLGPLLGQCCGGRVRLLVERLDPDRAEWLAEATPGATLVHHLVAGHVARAIGGTVPPPSARGEKPGVGATFGERLDPLGGPLLLFGAGHVGRAIAAKATGLPFALAWFDTRPEAAAHDGVMLVADHAIEACASDAPADAAILILTHDHALDYRLVVAALCSPARFVGLIGSATKRARFLSRLERDGFDAADRARLTCPIGLPGISGKAPDVIALATLAQLLSLPA